MLDDGPNEGEEKGSLHKEKRHSCKGQSLYKGPVVREEHWKHRNLASLEHREQGGAGELKSQR